MSDFFFFKLKKLIFQFSKVLVSFYKICKTIVLEKGLWLFLKIGVLMRVHLEVVFKKCIITET